MNGSISRGDRFSTLLGALKDYRVDENVPLTGKLVASHAGRSPGWVSKEFSGPSMDRWKDDAAKRLRAFVLESEHFTAESREDRLPLWEEIADGDESILEKYDLSPASQNAELKSYLGTWYAYSISQPARDTTQHKIAKQDLKLRLSRDSIQATCLKNGVMLTDPNLKSGWGEVDRYSLDNVNTVLMSIPWSAPWPPSTYLLHTPTRIERGNRYIYYMFGLYVDGSDINELFATKVLLIKDTNVENEALKDLRESYTLSETAMGSAVFKRMTKLLDNTLSRRLLRIDMAGPDRVEIESLLDEIEAR